MLFDFKSKTIWKKNTATTTTTTVLTFPRQDIQKAFELQAGWTCQIA